MGWLSRSMKRSAPKKKLGSKTSPSLKEIPMPFIASVNIHRSDIAVAKNSFAKDSTLDESKVIAMPQSRTTRRPELRSTSRLPGCGSAWKWPSRVNWTPKWSTKLATSLSRSTPGNSAAKVSLESRTPSTNSMAMARLATNSGTSLGTTTSTFSRSTAAAALTWLAASRVKSNSFMVTSRMVSRIGTMSGRPSGSAQRAMRARMPPVQRSWRKRWAAPRCCTFTTICLSTLAPGGRQLARWTWATDATPSGSALASTKMRSACAAPNSSRMVASTSARGEGLMRSCNCLSSVR
mmetsp:Transcript_82670/g.224529  ORF Transcript_82670/g.224529 Transcript_82670/m.224529 type:complete len:293 (-) Transcript_82670:68-946(-)